MFNKSFPWKNMVQPERPQMTYIIRRKRFACRITKATEHPEYVNISCFCAAATVPRTRLNILYRVSQEERSIFREVIVSAILSKNVYLNKCPISNGFRDRAI